MDDSRSPIPALYRTLRLPLMVAPMFLISGPDLVIAAGKAGVIAAFPAANARTLDDLAAWLRRIDGDLTDAGRAGQWAVNMIVHPTYDRFDAELDLIARHRPRIVITALGGPKRVLNRIHAAGGAVFCDVTTVLHAQKAVDAGADGLVLVASGAGGHTGTYSPFAFVEEVRAFWDGPLILGGAISSARSLRAALTLGADLAYMGTRFIATRESLVSDEYRAMLVRSNMSDIVTTKAITGVNANWMRESLERAGFDFSQVTAETKIDFSDISGGSKAWKNIWGAGHGVGQTNRVQSVAELIDDLARDYADLATEREAVDRWPKVQVDV
jgi:nitronate monooxygenase